MKLNIYKQQSALVLCPLDVPALRAALYRMEAALPAGVALPSPCVELHLVRDGSVAEANLQYMGCPGPTNILSFPGSGDLPGILLLSVDMLLREALLYGQNPAEHCLRLLAHGMGHLLGYDHGDEMDSLCALMEQTFAGRV